MKKRKWAEEGYRFIHIRNKRLNVINEKETFEVDTKGGFTLAWKMDGDILKVGISRCGEGDNYNKQIGRAISANRLGDYEFNLKEVPKEDFKETLAATLDGVVDMYIEKTRAGMFILSCADDEFNSLDPVRQAHWG